MKSSIERPPDQAGREKRALVRNRGGGAMGCTGEDEGALLGEDVAIVAPFRGVAVDGPAFAELGDAVTVEDLFKGAIDVDVGVWLGFFLGDVVHLDGPSQDYLILTWLERFREFSRKDF